MQITKIITDETLKELRDHGTKGFPFQYNYEIIQKYEEEKVTWHWHKELEFVKVMHGEIIFMIGNHKIRLKEGEGLFMNARVIHSIEDGKNGEIANFLFTTAMISDEQSAIYEKYIKEFMESDRSHIVLKPDVDWQQEILTKLQEVFMLCSEETELNELMLHILVCDLWLLIYEHAEKAVCLENMGVSLRLQSRLRKMMDYIKENYAEKIYLEDIAAVANVSKSEAMRCFQSGVQMSPVEYLNQYRLSKAKSELENTEDSIVQIAMKTGFASSNYFTRTFKHFFGISPKEYRNNKARIV